MSASSPRQLVVVGGNAAGMSAASKARRVDPAAKIIVVERGRYVSYGACGIPYLVAGYIENPEDLLTYPLTEFTTNRRIEVLLEHEALCLDTGAARVEVSGTVDQRITWLDYDALVLATGARASRFSGGPDLAGVFTVRTLDDGIAMLRFLEQGRPSIATVVGAGPLGLEMAEALATRGLRVTVLDALPRILPGFSDAAAGVVLSEMRDRGVECLTGEQVLNCEGDEHVSAVVTPSRTIPADMVVMAAGARPCSELACAAGLRLGPSGAISVDQEMRTSVDQVYAAGDCATVTHLVSRREVYIPRATTANKQGRVAGENAAGGRARLPGVLGSTVFKFFDLEVGRVGLNAAEAREAGFDAASASIRGRSRASYYPGARPVDVTLTADASTGRLLGAEMTGAEIAKRLDVVAAAIHAGQSCDDLAHLDMSYAPPFAPVWDPVVQAALEMHKGLRRPVQSPGA